MGLTQGCYKTAHDEIHVPNITPTDLEQKRQEEIEDPEKPTEQTPQADPKVEPKPEKNTNDGGSESNANAGASKKEEVKEPEVGVGGEALMEEAGTDVPKVAEKPQEANLQDFFDDMETQLQSIKELADMKRAKTLRARDVMPKLEENNAENRIGIFVWIAEAINLGLPIDSSIYQKLFDQYDIDQNGSLSMDEMKVMIREVAQSEVRLCDKALTSGELEKSLEKQPMGSVLLPMIRGQIEDKKRAAQARSEQVDETTANEIRKKLDVDADGRVTKIEFMAKIEETMWFEQQMNAKLQQQAGIGAVSELPKAQNIRPHLRDDVPSSPLVIATNSSKADLRA